MKKILFCLVLATPIFYATAAENASRVSLEKLLPKLEKAVDPQGKAKSIKTVLTRYQANIAQQRIQMKMSTIFKAPNKIKTIIRVKNMPATVEAFNGKSGWAMLTGMGVRPIIGPQLNFMRLTARMSNPGMRLQDIFPEISIDAKLHKVGIYNCYKLICVPDAKLKLPPVQIYIDTKQFFVRKMELSVVTAMGEVPSETEFGEYKQYYGIFLPCRQKTTTLGMEVSAKLLSVEFNKPVPDSEFSLPSTPPKPSSLPKKISVTTGNKE